MLTRPVPRDEIPPALGDPSLAEPRNTAAEAFRKVKSGGTLIADPDRDGVRTCIPTHSSVQLSFGSLTVLFDRVEHLKGFNDVPRFDTSKHS